MVKKDKLLVAVSGVFGRAVHNLEGMCTYGIRMYVSMYVCMDMLHFCMQPYTYYYLEGTYVHVRHMYVWTCCIFVCNHIQ